MLRLLLVCICSAYAHYPHFSFGTIGSQSRGVPTKPHHHNYISPHPSPSEPKALSTHNQEYSENSYWPEQDGHEEQKAFPESNAAHPPLHLNYDVDGFQKPWTAPAYLKSLEDLDRGLALMKSHLSNDYYTDKNEKANYVSLLYVVESLADYVAKNGWDAYNLYYMGLLRNYIDDVYPSLEPIIRQLDCSVLKATQQAVAKARQLIQRPAVQFVCEQQPTSCDAVIWSLLYTSPDYATKQSANALLAAGKSASTFLHYFAGAFKAVSKQVVFKYLLSAREDLKKLILVVIEARKLINATVKPDCGYQTHSKYNDYSPDESQHQLEYSLNY